jgi:outer membrane PBP1 activator LpoA protein
MLSPLGTVPPASMTVVAPELEAEAEAIAQQSVEDACRHPLLLEASGALAGRVNVAIMSYWRERIATPLAQQTLGGRESWRRAAEGWRRDNVDCMLFAGSGSVLMELRPYLRGVTTYVTSASYEIGLERTADWTGVRIADAPWLIDADRAEFSRYMPAEAPSPTLARLYALGVDAARLTLAAGRDTLPTAFDGAIGQLTLKDSQYRRQPMIGEFRERNLVKVGP